MAKKGVKMNLADFNGPQQSDLPSAPTGAESSFQRGGYAGRGGGRGGYGGDRGDREGGRGGYGDREERGPRRDRNEDGEGGEEEDAPSRADEADKWRRRDAPQPERRAEEMPGRSDNEDKWRPRGGAPSSGAGGFGGERRPYGGDRDGERRPYGGDRDGGFRSGGFDGERRSGGFDSDRRGGGGFDSDRRGGGFDSDRRGGGFGGDDRDRRSGGFGGDDRDRRGGGGFGESSGGDSRPAHLKNLVKKGNSSNDLAGDRAAGSEAPAAAAPAPVSSRFAKPPPEASEAGGDDGDRPAREERRPYGGDRDGGAERRPYGGDRDGGAERRPYGGDRDGGERRPYGGSSGAGGGRFGDRDGGSSGGAGSSRFGDRDGGRDGGERRPYGGGRDGGYEPRGAAQGVSRYGGYGGAARSGGAPGGDVGPLPSGPRQQESFDDAPRSALRKPTGAAAAAAAAKKKDELTAKPQAMEDRKVEVDESLTKKGVVSLAQKISPLETAVAENLTITADQLADSMNRLKIDSVKQSTVAEFGNVLAKSIIDGKITLAKLVASLSSSKSASASSASSSKGPASLLLETLVAFKSKKGDKATLELVSSADAALDIVGTISGGLKGAELDAFLDSKGLLILKPIPDLTASVAADLAAGAGPEKVLASIAAAVDPKLAPGLGVTNAVASYVFGLVFATAGKADLSVLPAWTPLLARVAPGFDSDAQLRLLFEAQAAWFKAGATKALLKDTFVALFTAKLVQALVFDAWRNDMTEKAKNGKSKALLQVHTWITDIQPKLRPSEEEQYGADEDLANEYGDGNDE